MDAPSAVGFQSPVLGESQVSFDPVEFRGDLKALNIGRSGQDKGAEDGHDQERRDELNEGEPFTVWHALHEQETHLPRVRSIKRAPHRDFKGARMLLGSLEMSASRALRTTVLSNAQGP